jgi:hypothetical protein|tara:strand:- start:227 stop:400 length:174 start_codon:yes stop_codon:yes gene_type:complete
MSKLTKEELDWMELEKLTAELEAEAIQMRVDYEENPSEMSGSVVVVHEDSEFLDEEE